MSNKRYNDCLSKRLRRIAAVIFVCDLLLVLIFIALVIVDFSSNAVSFAGIDLGFIVAQAVMLIAAAVLYLASLLFESPEHKARRNKK